jgi:molecular chaperone HscC
MTLDIGIDLGTTNSLIAVIEDGAPKLLPNASGSFLTPSCVSVGERGEVLVGQAARDRLVSKPEASAAAFKRLMGTRKETVLGKMRFMPEDLSALVLRSLKGDAEATLNVVVSEVVISVPAYFNDLQRKSTMDAARLAGLEVRRLVNEPTAAALAYGLNEKSEGKFLVFDLGGGTFDVSILDKYEDVMEIRSTTGDTRLGGEDFTSELEKLILKNARLEGQTGVRAELLRRQAELVKHGLSSRQAVDFQLVVNGKATSGTITRQEIEEACKPLLQRLKGPTERALRDANLSANDFEAVVLVGGATRMPMVRSLVARMFGRLPLVTIDPDTAIAQGAAVLAGLITRNGKLRDIVMTDVCPFTLGTASVDDPKNPASRRHVVPIIERNAVVPISRSMVFSTVHERQKIMDIEVYQGENLRPEANVLLGNVHVPVPAGKAGQESVDVRFTYDINGTLQVEAKVLSTEKVHSKIFSNSNGMDNTELENRFKMLEKLKVPPREQQENIALIARAERLYEEATGAAREEIRGIILAFEKDIEDQKMRNPDACRLHYSQLLDAFDHDHLQSS